LFARKKRETGTGGEKPVRTEAAAEYDQVKRSRSIFSYYLPVIVAAVIAIAVFTWSASWLSSQAASQRLGRLTRVLAQAVQHQVTEAVRDRSRMLEMLAGQPAVVSALEKQGEPGRLRQQLTKKLPGAGKVVPVPAGWRDEKVLETLSGSYAAAEMYQVALKKRRSPPAQVVRDGRGKQQMLMAVPVKHDDKVVGALVAVFPLDFLRQQLTGFDLEESYVALEQVYAGARLLLASAGDAGRKDKDGILKVPGTLWQVRYGAPGTSGLSWITLAALVAGGMLVLLVVTLLGYRKLAHDCKADMGLMVSLVDATLKRLGAATPMPHLSEARPAMELLARYAQATFAAEKAVRRAGSSKEDAGRMTVEEVESTVENEPPAESQLLTLDEEQLPLELFRGGTIRGRSGMELNEEVVQAIGLATGTLVQEAGGRQVVVGRDNRASSDAYASSLVAGLLASGCDVVDLGEVPAPLVSYAMCSSTATSGVMVTGGHNPPEYNGFKIQVDGRPLDESGCLELRQRVLDGNYRKGMGRLESGDFSTDYVNHVLDDIQLVEPFKLVLDCGNGVAGPLAQRMLERLGCEVVPLFCEPDGGFPNHLPDPSDTANLEALRQEVLAQGAQLGVALDADGDALALVDEQGRVVYPDHLLMVLAGDIIRRNPGADVVYDVASTAQLPEFILSNGGRPIMWRTGHAEIRSKLRESHGLLGGELSGHIYINDRWYGFDDGIYTMARLLELFSLDAVPVSEIFRPYAKTRATPLLILETPPGKAEQVVDRMKREGDFGDADIIDLDGLRVEFERAWGLVRASSTRPALVFRFEAVDDEALAEVQQAFRNLLRQVAPELQPPF